MSQVSSIITQKGITSSVAQKGVSSVIVQSGAAYDPRLKDRDGNVYTTVIIGSQEWIIENLRVTKYADGSAIPKIELTASWADDVAGAYCAYNNDNNNIADYGLLYNWYAVNKGLAYFTRSGIQESGWRVPTVTDWSALKTYIGGQSGGGGKLKEVGTTHWRSPNTGATDEYGFKALPSGYRDYEGIFTPDSFTAWTASADGVDNAWSYGAVYTTANTFDISWSKKYGAVIRCVRDI